MGSFEYYLCHEDEFLDKTNFKNHAPVCKPYFKRCYKKPMIFGNNKTICEVKKWNYWTQVY